MQARVYEFWWGRFQRGFVYYDGMSETTSGRLSPIIMLDNSILVLYTYITRVLIIGTNTTVMFDIFKDYKCTINVRI